MPQSVGMVHGRFQPFHVGHLEYVLMALNRCDQLIIGITNPEPSEFREEDASPHRHLPESNPYSWYDRMEMVRESLMTIGNRPQQFSVVPFHLFDSSKWAHYLPRPQMVTQYVRVFSEWEEKKIRLFEEYGFQVVVLDRGQPKKTEGVLVRELIRNGGPWRELVPEGTAKILHCIQRAAL